MRAFLAQIELPRSWLALLARSDKHLADAPLEAMV
jgi:hypothetical protein